MVRKVLRRSQRSVSKILDRTEKDERVIASIAAHRNMVLEKVSALIIAGFGLVAALAWNDAIKALFTEIFGERGSLIAMFSYAVLVTILAVIMAVWVGKMAQKTK